MGGKGNVQVKARPAGSTVPVKYGSSARPAVVHESKTSGNLLPSGAAKPAVPLHESSTTAGLPVSPAAQ